MVGIVVVSHSDALAEGVVTLAREMGSAELALVAAGGTDEPGVLGTDATRVMAAIEQAMSPDGVLVLMDLGSALMSTELAVDLLGETPGRVVLSEAPLVEGTVAAAASASGGASLDEVAAEARGALAMKTSQLGGADDAAPAPDAVPALDAAPAPDAETAPPADAQAVLEVRNAIGLHARPAARFVETVRRFDANVRVAKGPNGVPVTATSLTRVIGLGARLGDTLEISASGPQADDVAAGAGATGRRGVRRRDRRGRAIAQQRHRHPTHLRAPARQRIIPAWLASQPGARMEGDRRRAAGGRRRPHRCPRLGRARVRPRPPSARRHRPATGSRR